MGGGSRSPFVPPPTPCRGRRQREPSGREAAELSSVRAQSSFEGRGERCGLLPWGSSAAFPSREARRRSIKSEVLQKDLIIVEEEIGCVVPAALLESQAKSCLCQLHYELLLHYIMCSWTQEGKKPCPPADSVDSLMAEMPFADTDIEDEFARNKHGKEKEEDYWKGSSRRQGEERKKKKKQYQPNYFISLPITNPEIAGNVRAVQDAIIQKDDRLSKAMVHCGSLHVTMLVMHLSSKEEISIAIGALSDSKDFVEDLLKGRTVDLSFQGIDHFKNEVGFVQLAENDHTAILSEIAETMRKIFQEKGILAGEERAFKPHLTFMKLSKSTQLRKQVSSHFR
ncbi:A-kinase anchor protein 7-like [Meleagris gallopavo]|uniref:A-kinase anchor protein 7-like n=1 Tax=Meleagris gallopavo TaxID=9103 RepID=UPI0012ABC3CB|nr:A-kinase anchor protein 7-like [Meleagris gallopavo]